LESFRFLTRIEFEALSDEDALTYFDRLQTELDAAARDRTGITRRLDLIAHLEEVVGWVLTSDEFYKLVTRPSWDRYWAHAEEIAASLERALSSPELSDDERCRASALLANVHEVLEHKRSLDSLDEVVPRDGEGEGGGEG
jgi:hypothetical protein